MPVMVAAFTQRHREMVDGRIVIAVVILLVGATNNSADMTLAAVSLEHCLRRAGLVALSSVPFASASVFVRPAVFFFVGFFPFPGCLSLAKFASVTGAVLCSSRDEFAAASAFHLYYLRALR